MPGPLDISNFAKNTVDIYEDLDRRRSSACSSMSHLICDASVGGTLASGSAYGALAYNKLAGQTYTAIRFCTGATAPVSLTSVVLGVTDVTGSVLATTADQSAVIGTSASTLFDNIALVAPITLAYQQPVYVCIAWAGTTLNVAGLPSRNQGLMTLAQLTYPLMRTKTGYSTGPIPALTSVGGTTIVPWIELIP